MALDQVLKVIFIGDSRQLQGELKNLGGQLKNFALGANRAFTNLSGVFTSFRGALVGGALVAGIRRITNSLEELAVASKKTGVGVEELAKLRYAAEQSDVPIESLSKALKFLNQTLGEARSGNEKAAKSLEALGVSTTDSALPALIKVADTISKIPDAATRAALLTEVFKKSWEDIVPLLDGGGEAIRAAGDELERLGGVPSQKAADGADKLNDNLKKLTTSITGPLTVAIGGLLPLITDVSERFTTVAQASGGFLKALEDLGKRIGLGRLIGETKDELEGLREKLAELREQEAAGDFPLFGGTQELYGDIKKTEDAIARIEQRLVRLRERAGELQDQTPAVDVLIQGDPDAAAKLTAQATAASQAATAAVPPIVVPIALGPSGPIENYADLQAEFARQQAPGFASGGAIRGPGTGLSDSILARLSAGEFVVRAAAVKNYGLGFLERLNSMSLPRFASGGPVGTPINLHIGDRSYAMSAEPSVARQLGRILGTEVLKRGRR